MCVSVKSDSSLQNLLHNHCNGWFFAICKKTLNIIKNNILPNSVMCNPFQQDSNKVHTLDGPLLQTNSSMCKTIQQDSQPVNPPPCSLQADIPIN